MVKRICGEIFRDAKSVFPGLLAFGVYIFLVQGLYGAVCPVRILLGVPCPGCGMTRAVQLLFSGDVIGSIKMHPMVIALVAGGILFFDKRYVQRTAWRWWKKYVLVCAVAFFVIYVVRMKLFFPHMAPMLYEPKAVLPLLIRGIRGGS